MKERRDRWMNEKKNRQGKIFFRKSTQTRLVQRAHYALRQKIPDSDPLLVLPNIHFACLFLDQSYRLFVSRPIILLTHFSTNRIACLFLNQSYGFFYQPIALLVCSSTNHLACLLFQPITLLVIFACKAFVSSQIRCPSI